MPKVIARELTPQELESDERTHGYYKKKKKTGKPFNYLLSYLSPLYTFFPFRLSLRI